MTMSWRQKGKHIRTFSLTSSTATILLSPTSQLCQEHP